MCAAAALARMRTAVAAVGTADVADIARRRRGAAPVDERRQCAPWIRTGSKRTHTAMRRTIVDWPDLHDEVRHIDDIGEIPTSKNARQSGISKCVGFRVLSRVRRLGPAGVGDVLGNL